MAIGVSLASWPAPTGPAEYPLGEVQPTTVIADMDFPVLKDVQELERERERRLETVPAVVVREDSSSVSAYRKLRWIRDQVETLRARGGDATTGADRSELVLTFSQSTLLSLLLGPRTDELLSQAELLLQEVMQRGYVDMDLAEELAAYPSVRITDLLGSVTIPSDQLMTPDRVGELARSRAVQAGLPAGALADIVLHCAEPNLRLEQGDTKALREEAVASVEPHTRIVRRGEKIIGAHEVIYAGGAARPPVLRLLAGAAGARDPVLGSDRAAPGGSRARLRARGRVRHVSLDPPAAAVGAAGRFLAAARDPGLGAPVGRRAGAFPRSAASAGSRSARSRSS
ncbi:MAG: hypothetical protein R3E12_06235 [Candidatus Eisenbacteria bacterium]